MLRFTEEGERPQGTWKRYRSGTKFQVVERRADKVILKSLARENSPHEEVDLNAFAADYEQVPGSDLFRPSWVNEALKMSEPFVFQWADSETEELSAGDYLVATADGLLEAHKAIAIEVIGGFEWL